MTGGAHGQQQDCCALPHEMGLKSQFLNCITDVSLFKLKSITAFTAKIAKLLISNQVLLRYQVFVHMYACHTALCKFLSFLCSRNPHCTLSKGCVFWTMKETEFWPNITIKTSYPQLRSRRHLRRTCSIRLTGQY